MVWLATKMWLLLLLAFLLGIFCTSFILRRAGDEDAYLDRYDDDRDDNDRPLSVAKSAASSTTVTKDDELARGDALEETIPDRSADDEEEDRENTTKPSMKVREYGNVPPKREKIYEKDLEPEDRSHPDITGQQGDSLHDTADSGDSTDLDKVDSFAPTTPHPIAARAPDLLEAPLHGPADDLRLIRGIGPSLEKSLNAKGIYYYDQIAAWTPEEVVWVERDIDFPDRVSREGWVHQAQALKAQKTPATPPLQTPPVQQTQQPPAAPVAAPVQVPPPVAAAPVIEPPKVATDAPTTERSEQISVQGNSPASAPATPVVPPGPASIASTPETSPELEGLSAFDRLQALKKAKSS